MYHLFPVQQHTSSVLFSIVLQSMDHHFSCILPVLPILFLYLLKIPLNCILYFRQEHAKIPNVAQYDHMCFLKEWFTYFDIPFFSLLYHWKTPIEYYITNKLFIYYNIFSNSCKHEYLFVY